MYNLLIAEDEEIERIAFLIYLKDAFPNINVFEAENGEEALEIAREQHPEIIVVDIEMPEVSGIDVIRLLREEEIDSQIIVHTAYDYFDYAKDALNLGANAFLLKPVRHNELGKTIQSCLERIEKQHTNKTKSGEEDLGGEDNQVIGVVEHAIQFMREHYREDLYLNLVAEKTGVSPFYLSRLFKQETDMTFVSFLNEVRIEKITEMISTGNYTIKELAEKTGFQEPTYLCKVIKRRTGKTIGELKRMYAQQISG